MQIFTGKSQFSKRDADIFYKYFWYFSFMVTISSIIFISQSRTEWQTIQTIAKSLAEVALTEETGHPLAFSLIGSQLLADLVVLLENFDVFLFDVFKLLHFLNFSFFISFRLPHKEYVELYH